ncbi:hypothetical protein ACJX0J_023638, partial [Zea mays]
MDIYGKIKKNREPNLTNNKFLEQILIQKTRSDIMHNNITWQHFDSQAPPIELYSLFYSTVLASVARSNKCYKIATYNSFRECVNYIMGGLVDGSQSHAHIEIKKEIQKG